MDAPLSIPADPTLVSSVRRAISSLRLVRRLLGIPEEKPALASVARTPASLRSFDWDGPDTSLTQAELEVLK